MFFCCVVVDGARIFFLDCGVVAVMAASKKRQANCGDL
jgi:hypothetical protein